MVERSWNQTTIKAELMKLINDNRLTEREEKVIRLRWGIGDGYCRTLEEVGQVFNITPARIKQIEVKVIQKLKRVKMRPSYEELISLSPFLGEKKTRQEVEELMDAIENCGYQWDLKSKMFFNTEISLGIRTQGLDLFTPEKFRKWDLERRNEAIKYPEQTAAKRLWGAWFSKILCATFLWAFLGWIFVSWQIWFLVLLSLIVGFVCFRIYCFRKMQMPDEWLEEQKKKYSSK
ncbi:MAG: hypothetical protein A2987_05565 [Omnitrophica bacterium RIFCSPLOWO2_01_FULL_45_10]|nr:MAG: hypothetical protein A2987_05565 [Omnitrophica bacterium RIFCSPLOWO2_01_FULL_45_10]